MIILRIISPAQGCSVSQTRHDLQKLHDVRVPMQPGPCFHGCRQRGMLAHHMLTGHLLCRGGMIFTFYKARGMAVGSSLVEEDKLDLAKKLEEAAKAKGVEFILPTDVVIADKFDENANTKVVSAEEIPDGWMVSITNLATSVAGCSVYGRICSMPGTQTYHVSG